MPGYIVVIILVAAAVAILPFAGFILLLIINSKISQLEMEMLRRFAKLDETLKKLQAPPAAPQAAAKPSAVAEEAAASGASKPEPAAYTPETAWEEFAAKENEKAEEPADIPSAAPALDSTSDAIRMMLDARNLKAAPKSEEQFSKPDEQPKQQEEPSWTPPPSQAPAPASDFERNAQEAIKKIWSWLLVGEEREGVSLEYAIATTWLVRGAIIIILAALAFGINYSIKNGLIGPEGRVALCFAAGIFMTVWGLWLAKGKYRPAAQGLMGGGFAALYFSAFASAMIYKLIPQPAAFGLMILITAGACLVAVRANAMLIAIIATIGGYLTPVMLSTGVKNLPGLFGYIAMLGCGLLYVSRLRDWPLLNSLCLAFTWILYYLSLHKFYDKSADYSVALAGGVAFFLIFSLVPLLYNLAQKRKSTALELVLMLFNSAAFFAGAHALTIAIHPKESAAAISLALAAYNICFAWMLRKRDEKDYGLFCMLYAFAAFFVAFSVPLLFGSEWITAAWSLQALALLWLSLKLRGRFLESLAYVLYAIAGVRLIAIDMPVNFHDIAPVLHATAEVANVKAAYFAQMPSRIGTFATFIGSLACAWQLLARFKPAQQSENVPESQESRMALGTAFLLCGVAALVLYLHFEFSFLAKALMPSLKQPLMSAIWTVGLFAALWQWGRSKSAIAANVAFVFGAGLLIKLFIFDMPSFWINGKLLFDGPLGLDFICMRLLDFVPALLALGMGMFAARQLSEPRAMKAFCTSFLVALFAYLTLEFKSLAHAFTPGFEAGSVSVFWGVFALGLLLTGIRKDIGSLRASGLILFLVTAIKIFAFDLASLSPLARIGAFMGLGLATLAGAFVYMRFRSTFEKPQENSGGETEGKHV